MHFKLSLLLSILQVSNASYSESVIQGDLRIAHCGGFHSNLDRLITAFNVLAKLLHHNIRWDSETIGCEPSLSSIPAAEQRTLLTAMQELADWLAMPQNQQEFLIVFFDDQMDLASWVSMPMLLWTHHLKSDIAKQTALCCKISEAAVNTSQQFNAVIRSSLAAALCIWRWKIL